MPAGSAGVECGETFNGCFYVVKGVLESLL